MSVVVTEDLYVKNVLYCKCCNYVHKFHIYQYINLLQAKSKHLNRNIGTLVYSSIMKHISTKTIPKDTAPWSMLNSYSIEKCRDYKNTFLVERGKVRTSDNASIAFLTW